jgi:PPM family protein phosphatase
MIRSKQKNQNGVQRSGWPINLKTEGGGILDSESGLWSDLRVVTRSDVGRVRARNEDSLAVLAEWNWLVLSDGMGGYRGGDVASRLAVEALSESSCRFGGSAREAASALEVLKGAIEEANALILRTAAGRPELAGMGATVVAAIFLPGRLVVGHVGDSRLYRLRRGELLQLTRDHTLLQEQLDRGIITAEAARLSPVRGMLTRALGVDATVQPDLASYPALSGDTYLMCSDGVTDMIADEEIMELMADAADLQGAAERVVDLANDRGGRDNISLILAYLA